MDFKQEKLTKDEWDALEIPIIGDEFDIISLIYEAGKDVTKEKSNILTLIDFIKIDESEGIHEFLYTKYFEKTCKWVDQCPFTVKKIKNYSQTNDSCF